MSVKGFHLTHGWHPDAVKRSTMACQGVVLYERRPDANALHGVAHRRGAFTIQRIAVLMHSSATGKRAKV